MDYIVVSTSKCKYQEWQIRCLYWSMLKTNQEGKLILLLSDDINHAGETTDFNFDPSIEIHELPDWAKEWEINEGEWWGGIPNKYEAIKWLTDNREFNPDDTLLFLDPDMIFLEPINLFPNENQIIAQVIQGGMLSSNKGFNLPNTNISQPALTEKDIEDAIFSAKQNVDWIALSFVRHGSDIESLIKLLDQNTNHRIPVIAKIEKPEGVRNIDEIMKFASGIMVARGDLGVEINAAEVPLIQKKLVNKAKKARIPVIIATQMMESMMKSLNPNRAEVNDVANSIMDGADAVMLSGETASGDYPVETVKTMVKIIEDAEQTPKERPFLRHVDLSSVQASVMVAASLIGEKVYAKRILAVTESGVSCLKLAKFRPTTPCLGVTTTEKTARKMCMYWGIEPFLLKNYREDSFNFQYHVINKVKKKLKLVNGDKLVITRGDGKFFRAGSSNSVKVDIIKDTPKVLGSGGDTLEEASDDKKKILLDHNICASCQRCVEICPHAIWKINPITKDTFLNKEQIHYCNMDLQCISVCPTGAIEIIPNYDT